MQHKLTSASHFLFATPQEKGEAEIIKERWAALDEAEQKRREVIYASRHRGRVVLTPLKIRIPRTCNPGERGAVAKLGLKPVDTKGMAMMPSMGLQFRKILAQRGKLYETSNLVRDRDKNWRLDSFRNMLANVGKAGNAAAAVATAGKVTSVDGLGDADCELSADDPKTWDKGRVYIDGHLLSKRILHKEVCMISNTYCVVTVYGLGIHGRVCESCVST